jgi:mRNA interferase MazF
MMTDGASGGDGGSPLIDYAPRRVQPVIRAAPKIRQIYWCEFPKDAWLPEFGKMRPVLIISYRHVLNGHCLVLPITTAVQEGLSAEWAHLLQYPLNQHRDSIVVCNHLCTVSNARLRQFGRTIPRISVEEFQVIIQKLMLWLPAV